MAPGRSPAIARYDALQVEAAGLPAAELTLQACRAVLMAMSGNAADARSAMAASRGARGAAVARDRALPGAARRLRGAAGGDPEAAERAIVEVEASATESGDRWYMAMAYIERALTILAQRTRLDAAQAVARINTLPTPCDGEWIIKRHTARALLAAQEGDHERGLADARGGRRGGRDCSRLILPAQRAAHAAELLWATGAPRRPRRAVRARWRSTRPRPTRSRGTDPRALRGSLSGAPARARCAPRAASVCRS